MKSENEIKLKAKIEVLQYLNDRECNCDKSKCSEHFNYIRALIYDYQTRLDESTNEEK